jgi:hypothetical protein
MMKIFFWLLLTFFLQNAWAAHEQIYWGEPVQVGDGYARSYMKMHHTHPSELGVALSEGGTQNLPQIMQEFILPLPTEVNLSPYKHITFDWNPHGHEPDGVYDKPHFDIHFYFISNEQRQLISCQGEDAVLCTKNISAQYLPSFYAPTPAGVPLMGWHWVDLLAPEFNGGIFTRTFIYGYYDGLPIFIEPMVTLEFLLSKEISEKEIRTPVKFARAGHYPKTYKVYFDNDLKMYKILLKDFKHQCAD